jgi:hypothetical protein
MLLVIGILGICSVGGGVLMGLYAPLSVVVIYSVAIALVWALDRQLFIIDKLHKKYDLPMLFFNFLTMSWVVIAVELATNVAIVAWATVGISLLFC